MILESSLGVEFLNVTDEQTTDTIVQVVSTISLHIHTSNAPSLPFHLLTRKPILVS